MNHRSLDVVRTHRVCSSFLSYGLIAIMAWAFSFAGHANAADWQSGDLSVRLDSFASISTSMRVSDRDCNQIAGINGGCNFIGAPGLNGRLLNSDDGNLNVDQWDVYSVMVSMGHDLDINWKEKYGAFFRVSYFYDAVQNGQFSGQFPRRTDIDRNSQYNNNILEGGTVGLGFRLLDAYVYAKFDILDSPWDLRVGNQVINWGEEFFTQGGVKVTNAFDVTKLRVAGTELKEGLLPAPMVHLSGNLFDNLSLDAYYQFAWNKTEIDPPGTFYSISDLVGRGMQGQFNAYDPGSSDPTNASGCSPQMSANCLLTSPGHIPAQWGAVPSRDRDASSQNQYGVALRYYADALETEFAVYHVVFHDKIPTVSYRFMGETLPGWPAGVPFPDFLKPNVPGNIGVYREYLENIKLYGASFSTVLFDVAVGGELSYRPNQPTPITTAFTDMSTPGGGRPIPGPTSRGAVREERLMAIVNGLYNAAPSTPVLGDIINLIGADDMVLIGEVAMVRYPHLDIGDVVTNPLGNFYAGPPGTRFQNKLFPNPGQQTPDMFKPDKTSWGYQIRVSANYTQFLGSAWTVTPAILFRHDVSGSTPDSAVQFNEGTKTAGVSIEGNYQSSWRAILAYNNSWGAGAANMNGDRDFLQLTVSYAF